MEKWRKREDGQKWCINTQGRVKGRTFEAPLPGGEEEREILAWESAMKWKTLSLGLFLSTERKKEKADSSQWISKKASLSSWNIIAKPKGRQTELDKTILLRIIFITWCILIISTVVYAVALYSL